MGTPVEVPVPRKVNVRDPGMKFLGFLGGFWGVARE
jgi:hypothetical protein